MLTVFVSQVNAEYEVDAMRRDLEDDLAGELTLRDVDEDIFSEPTRERRAEKHLVNMCFVCDKYCTRAIGGRPQRYFNGLAGAVSKLFNTLGYHDWQIKNHKVVGGGLKVKSYYRMFANRRAKGVSLVASVSNKFWKKLWGKARSIGCDIGFAVVNKRDYLWRKASGIDGVANMFKVCSGHSFGVIKTIRDGSLMATTLAHEVGHLFGMYHDGALNRRIAKMSAKLSAKPGVGPVIKDLKQFCTAGNHYCPYGANKCVMRASGQGTKGFSKCSMAYLELFFALSKTYPSFYHTECIDL